MKKWKYAISSADKASANAPILLQGSICENLRKAAALGYDAIEVHTRENVVYDFEEIRKVEQETGVKVAIVVTGRLNTEGKLNFSDEDSTISDAAMEGMKLYIDMAEKLQADIVIGWAKGNVKSEGVREEYIKRLADNLRILADYAKKKGVKINLEVINRYEVNIFVTAKEVMDFLEMYPIDNLYVHLDTFHMGIEEKNMYEAIGRCAGKIGYVHVADNTREYPGSGCFNFMRVMETLEAAGYDGYISVECLPRPDGETAAKEAIHYLKAMEK